jgi:hypothetical protein
MTSTSGTYAAFFDQRNGYRQIWLARLSGTPGTPAWNLVAPFPSTDENGNDLAMTPPAIDSGSSVHAAWIQWTEAEAETVMHASFANGAWSEARSISAGTGSLGRRDPVIAVRNGVVAAAWAHYGANNQHQVYAAWLRNGAWSPATAVLPAPKTMWGVRPSVAIDGAGRLHVAYGESEGNGRGKLTIATRDLNGAGPWTYGRIDAPFDSDWCGQSNPQIKSDGGSGLHAVWTGCGPRNPPAVWPHAISIYYAQSSDNGARWSAPLKVAAADAVTDNSTSAQPALAVGSGDAMLLYPARGTASHTLFAVTIRNGAASAPVKLAENDTDWLEPGTYAGQFYPGDGRAAVTWDGSLLRYVTLFPDRRNGRTVNLFTSSFGEQTVRQTYLPLTRR